MTNRDKHTLAVTSISNYISTFTNEMQLINESSNYDIHMCNSGLRIKIFSNNSNSPRIKIPANFEPQKNVVYLVTKPTTKNALGITYVGGGQDVIRNAITYFKTKDAPANIVIDKLKPVNLKKYIKAA